ncbi:MAG: hypothetical protein RIB03_03755 [Henriciella sp.]|uniref:hypothetical protein n=1 Tax=Henriciella sp. TaxID=1968823 RepID=UPI0032F02CB6
MNWFLNMFSEISDIVTGGDGAERDRSRRSANDNASPDGENFGPAANDEHRRRRLEGYGEISDWDW